MTDFPQLKLQANIIFPGSVSSGAGIDVALANGNYTLSLDYPDFAPPVSIAPDLSHQNVLLWNSITGTYTLASAALLVSGGSVPEAPNDGQIYGRQSLAWTPAPGSAPSNTNPLADGVASPGTSIQFSRGDHVHPTDTSRAPLASPTFTGIPAAPTASPGTSTTQIATTAFVAAAIAAAGGGGGGGGPGSFTTNIVGGGSYIVPSGKTTMVGEAWGGGGGAQQLGGGGGGYSRFTTSVTPGQTIFYNVGNGGGGANVSGAFSGGNSWVNPSANSQPSSNGCVGGFGAGASGGVGGGGNGTIGTTNFQGGNGGNLAAGGGGGGAGSAGNGATATTSSGGAGGALDGGNGGTGGGTPVNGSIPGGGGGGGPNTGIVGGAGGQGQVRLTFS